MYFYDIESVLHRKLEIFPEYGFSAADVATALQACWERNVVQRQEDTDWEHVNCIARMGNGHVKLIPMKS